MPDPTTVVIKHDCYQPTFQLTEDEPDQVGTFILTCDNCGFVVAAIDTAENFCDCCVGDVHVHIEGECLHPCCPGDGDDDA